MPLTDVAAPVASATVGGWAFWLSPLSLLHAATALLLAIVAVAWGRHDGRWRLVASAVAVAAVTVGVYVAMVRPGDLPLDWITVLHHGLERKAIMHLYARGVHAGANLPFVAQVAAGGQSPGLRDIVWLNLLLAMVNAGLFLHLAWRCTTPVWAVVWTLVFALNPAMFLAAFSELPTHVLALYFLCGVLAWATLTDARPQPRLVRAAAWAAVAGLSLLAACTRPEVSFLGVVALAVHAADVWLGPQRWAALRARLAAACAGPLAALAARPALIVGLCLASWWFAKGGIPWGVLGRSEVSALYPFNPSFASLFVYLPLLLLPIGASLGVLFGWVHGLRHFRRFGGLALSVFVLVRLYFAAQYEYFEMGRYFSYVMPAVLLLGLFGKAELDALAARWRPPWRQLAGIGWLMAWFTLPLPGVPEFYQRPEYTRAGGFAQLLLDRNNQREQRFLLGLTERHPACVFVARIVQDFDDPMHDTRYFYVVFGKPVPAPIFVPESEATLEQVIARYAGDAACVRLYYGNDCNLTFADRCSQFVAGRRLLEEERFWSRPYNNTLQSGYGAPEIALQVYAWP